MVVLIIKKKYMSTCPRFRTTVNNPLHKGIFKVTAHAPTTLHTLTALIRFQCFHPSDLLISTLIGTVEFVSCCRPSGKNVVFT
jgi:hypothetical protein